MILSGLHIYPIKSAAAVDLTQSRVDELGLLHDRRMMVVERTGRMVTQRGAPRLALVRPVFDGDRVVVSAPGMPDLAFERDPGDGIPLDVEVWGDWCRATRAPREVDRWFSAFLDREVRFVHLPATTVREVDPTFAPPGSRVGFADGFPFLMTTEASLADLNARLSALVPPSPIPMDRFRPNLVISGAGAWDEDGWRELRIGTLRFVVAKPCARCVITTVDQRTGETSREPLETLASFRKAGNKVLFGQNLVHKNRGFLHVGDDVEVLR